ncbi:MAG: hypothetical protein AAGI88_02505 [Pseudomonadota bacterium]
MCNLYSITTKHEAARQLFLFDVYEVDDWTIASVLEFGSDATLALIPKSVQLALIA